jgi:hypothetical protein
MSSRCSAIVTAGEAPTTLRGVDEAPVCTMRSSTADDGAWCDQPALVRVATTNGGVLLGDPAVTPDRRRACVQNAFAPDRFPGQAERRFW